MSKTVREVNRLVRTGVHSTDELAAVISEDPMMAASVLRRVNSAFYGVRRQVADLKKAVTLLGFDDVANLVLTASFLRLADMVSNRAARQLFTDLMQLSLGSAMYGALIAEELGMPEPATAYSAGLMHTSGRVVMLFNFGEAYTRLCRPGTPRPFPDASTERSTIGIDHAQASGLAMTEWQMPADLVQVVSCLEAPGRIDDVRLRDVALCVSVGVSATEQLCLRNAPGLAFEAKAALHVLARMRGKQSSQIAARINEERKRVNDHIAQVAGDLALA
ncbi:MAG: HDOD domain-containing protein [Rhodothermales bacterium]|nr:HDOD domain-containing protein [Rhodothermales bacterium]MBO6779823.1 HDOD domain-containing protein [Rhodothermales bacterium]